jgi:hypothetical protein
VADVHLDKIPQGRQLRDRAKAWLEVKNDSAVGDELAALRAEVAALKKQLKPSRKRVFTAEQRKKASEEMRARQAAKKAENDNEQPSLTPGG